MRYSDGGSSIARSTRGVRAVGVREPQLDAAVAVLGHRRVAAAVGRERERLDVPVARLDLLHRAVHAEAEDAVVAADQAARVDGLRVGRPLEVVADVEVGRDPRLPPADGIDEHGVLAEVVDDVLGVVGGRDPLPVRREVAAQPLAASGRAEDLARLPRLRVHREDRGPDVLVVVAPRVDRGGVELVAPRVPHERPDVGVDGADEAPLSGGDVEAPHLERERPVRVGVEDDRGRLVGPGLGFSGRFGLCVK
jgi:hypothetical protein